MNMIYDYMSLRVVFLLFIIASMIQNISGLKPIIFYMLFHDLKVVVNRSYDYMFIRGVFHWGNLCFNRFMNYPCTVFLLFIIAFMIQNISGLKPIVFSLWFHDLKVVVNRWYEYLFIRGVFHWWFISYSSLFQFFGLFAI